MIVLSPKFRRNLLDKLGLSISVVCAVHCLIMALLPFILPSLVESGCCSDCEDWTFHSVSAIAVLFIALAVFARPCTLRDKSQLLKLAGGFALLFSPLLFHQIADYESVLTVLGTLFIASAHWQNLLCHRRSRTCEGYVAPLCDRENISSPDPE